MLFRRISNKKKEASELPLHEIEIVAVHISTCAAKFKDTLPLTGG